MSRNGRMRAPKRILCLTNAFKQWVGSIAKANEHNRAARRCLNTSFFTGTGLKSSFPASRASAVRQTWIRDSAAGACHGARMTNEQSTLRTTERTDLPTIAAPGGCE